MAKVIEVGDNLILKLSLLEKIGGLHKEVLKGVRAPGTGIPYVILLGTMKYKDGRDFTAIYKRRPVTIYEFKDCSYSRWIISE